MTRQISDNAYTKLDVIAINYLGIFKFKEIETNSQTEDINISIKNIVS